MILALFSISLLFVSACAEARNHPEIEWKTITTEHFRIQFHGGEEWLARRAALIAEEIYGPVTDLYGYKPGDHVYLNLFDKEDRSVGAAYYYLNRIDISASGSGFLLRGTVDWLRNVITHEFTHMISLQSSMKLSRKIPAIYFQVVSFEKEKRPDVITGYPNFQASIPISEITVPAWFAEGMAQNQCKYARHDYWDSHRDMLLRIAALSDQLLSMDEMGVFGKNSLQSEMVYNQGYSMVRFIVEKYGQKKLDELVNASASFYRWSFDSACRKTLGQSADDLYHEWKVYISERYRQDANDIGKERIGEERAGDGYININPISDGEGGYYYLSNCGHDYMGTSLILATDKGKRKVIADGVHSGFDLSSDGRNLCYSRRTSDNPYGYARDDVFTYNIRSGEEERITRGMRVDEPVWSPSGDSIACITTRGGSSRVMIIHEGGRKYFITPPSRSRRYFGLSWGARGILATRFEGVSRNVVLIDLESGTEKYVLHSMADERDPCWDSSGNGFFYSCDASGIFNIYHMDIEDSTVVRCTNSIGGCFDPSMEGDGILFSVYGEDGFRINGIANWKESAEPVYRMEMDSELIERRSSCLAVDSVNIVPTLGRGEHDDSETMRHKPLKENGRDGDGYTGLKAENFGIEYTSLFIFPRILVYEEKPRLGIFIDSRDFLDRQSVSAGGSVNMDGEFDIQLSFVVRQFNPTFSFNLFRKRKYYSFYSRDYGVTYENYTRYDLWDAFLSCSYEFKSGSPFQRNEIALEYNHGEYGLNIERLEVIEADKRNFRYSVGWNYYKSNEFSLIYHYRDISASVNGDINPGSGRVIDIAVTAAFDKLFTSNRFEYAFQPLYTDNYFGRYVARYKEYLPLPFWSHVLSIQLTGGVIDSDVDDFFNLFLGGRDGLRGYSYYSMGGKKLAMARLIYRFPILPRIDRQIFSIYLSSLYGGLFTEAGKAWDKDELDLNGNKKDVGFELRVKGFSFYTYPIAASFEAAYGLDDITYTDPFYEKQTFYEGNKWKLYGSVLFNF